jgi:phosphate transport system substrate-binding protein
MIDGAEATVENIKSGTYKVSRPFNIATKGTVNDATQAFIDFILSSEGQAVVEENGYISAGNNGAFSGKAISGKVVVVGSSSVAPVMEKLKEAYIAVNPNAEIEIQQNDSTTGMNSVKEGICDIGMASRELKDSEIEAGLTPIVMAMDGIAVIVNNENAVSGLTSEQVKAIFTGEITNWGEIDE